MGKRIYKKVSGDYIRIGSRGPGVPYLFIALVRFTGCFAQWNVLAILG